MLILLLVLVLVLLLLLLLVLDLALILLLVLVWVWLLLLLLLLVPCVVCKSVLRAYYDTLWCSTSMSPTPPLLAGYQGRTISHRVRSG